MKQSNDQTDFQAQDDADVLTKHAAITADPKRHKAAHAVLQKKAADTQQAADQSQQMMKTRGKVKKGLQKAFPKDGGSGSTPFDKAGQNGGTPFDDAK